MLMANNMRTILQPLGLYYLLLFKAGQFNPELLH